MLLLYYTILFVPKSSIIFSVSCDCIAIVTVICNVTLTLILSPKIRNKWKRKGKIRVKINQVLYS